eukprot:scaffold1237_cov243-Pinguiococcus_pyrenoidosus.AAC.10
MARTRLLVALVALAALLAPQCSAQDDVDEGQLQEILRFDFNEPTLSGWTFWPFAALSWTHTPRPISLLPKAGGETETVGTGPSSDADGGPGLYLFVDASCAGQFGCNAVCERRDAIVLSPPLDNQLVGAFEFQFHMWAEPVATVNGMEPCNLPFDTMGDLTVEAIDEENNPITETPLFFVSGNQGNQWNDSGVIFIPETSGTIRLEFTVFTGPHWASDIAIDNVVIYQRNSFVNGNLDPQDDDDGDGNDDEQLILWLIVAIVLTCAVCCVCCYYCPHPYWTVAAEKRREKDDYDEDTLELKVSTKPNPQLRGVGYSNYASNFHPERVVLGEDGAPMLGAPYYSSSKSFRSLVAKHLTEESDESSATSESDVTEESGPSDREPRPADFADGARAGDRRTPVYDEEKAEGHYHHATPERQEPERTLHRTANGTPRYGFMEDMRNAIPEDYEINGGELPHYRGEEPEESRLSTILESQMSQSSHSANGTMRSNVSHHSPNGAAQDASETGSHVQVQSTRKEEHDEVRHVPDPVW